MRVLRRPLACVAALVGIAAGGAGAPLELETLDGRAVATSPSAPGQTLLAHFWATWCPSCVEELGVLDAAARACDPDRVRIVAVNVGEGVDEIRAYLERHLLALEVLRDPKGRVWRSLGSAGLPTNLLWRGDARRVEVGPRSRAQWERELAGLGCAR